MEINKNIEKINVIFDKFMDKFMDITYYPIIWTPVIIIVVLICRGIIDTII